MAQVLEKIRRAVLDGAESQAYRGSQGRYLMAGGRRTKLIEAAGKVTAAGRAYYQEVLGIAPPRLFAYEQPLIDDKWVIGFSGQRVLVRRRQADGSWTITKAGENYFRYNRDEYEVEVPYVILKLKTPGNDALPSRADATNVYANELPPRNETERQRYYAPLGDEEARDAPPWKLTVRNYREARANNRSLAATLENKEGEIVAAAGAQVEARTTIHNTKTGTSWKEVHWLYQDVIYVWDRTRPFRVSARRTNIYDEEPPTTQVILNRPLASHAVPDGFLRPWELHEDVF